jgi:signal transduction histidine kinase
MKRATVRVRLTVLYGGLFFLAGAVLLSVMYLLVKQNLDTRLGTSNTFVGFQASTQVPGTALNSDTPVATLNGQTITAKELPRVIAQRQGAIRDDTLHSLLVEGGVALGVIGVVAAGFGWLMGERALRPVHQITATARRVAAAASTNRGLHERIALKGPQDEIKELADTFDDMLGRLDRSFDGQRRFVANASHELRTPLAINRAMAEVAMTRPAASPDARQLAESVLLVNARHERLIDGLLTLAESENEVTERVPVDLCAVVEHVLAGTDLRGTTCLSKELASAPVHGDPVLLERMTQNLVDNAVKHNRPGGWLSVATGVEGGRPVLRVSNTGKPVAPYDLETVFEPFRRLNGDRVRSERGFGLGLSIVRAVARAHGGDAAATPGPDGGLTVTVRLTPT